ncbi:uncharacterized protein LOC108511464 [Phoenix dactylifera]|uniref:Uncharacterized protein LOC108511464 n=1 Tax=Phoenix dactylifera TaxID=42345 RepID=A0A8B9AIB6_PHODC|nr:uncharacterized protein LOC108511464 [Phoenix dactylifera]XP_038985530.1 uncharacterized protein LOC108511464 [Phoenix dactylifera]
MHTRLASRHLASSCSYFLSSSYIVGVRHCELKVLSNHRENNYTADGLGNSFGSFGSVTGSECTIGPLWMIWACEIQLAVGVDMLTNRSQSQQKCEEFVGLDGLMLLGHFYWDTHSDDLFMTAIPVGQDGVLPKIPLTKERQESSR